MNREGTGDVVRREARPAPVAPVSLSCSRTLDSEKGIQSCLVLGLVGVELGGSTELDNSRGSSPGLGGGIGALRSTSGISSLTVTGAGVDFFFLDVVGFADLRLEDLLMRIVAVTGVAKTSFGGVKMSVGGSYGGMGVALLRDERAPRTERRRLGSSGERALRGTGGM